MNFTSTYTLSPDGATGAFNPDGKTWSGLVGMLTRDEIDVAVSEFTITEARSHFVDFSIPMMTTGYVGVLLRAQVVLSIGKEKFVVGRRSLAKLKN